MCHWQCQSTCVNFSNRLMLFTFSWLTLWGQLNLGFNMSSLIRDKQSQSLMTASEGRGFLRQTKLSAVIGFYH
jgi:hypothetical protein